MFSFFFFIFYILEFHVSIFYSCSIVRPVTVPTGYAICCFGIIVMASMRTPTYLRIQQMMYYVLCILDYAHLLERFKFLLLVAFSFRPGMHKIFDLDL